MLLKTTFEKKYSLISNYIIDDVTRNNLMKNEAFFEKYKSCSTIIKILISELEKNCYVYHGDHKVIDSDHIRNVIVDVIIKFPESMLKSFGEAYLNSEPLTKSDRNIVKYYNECTNHGIESTKYIEKYGIITNRNRKNLPSIVYTEMTNNKFEELACDVLLKNRPLSEYNFSVASKSYLINIIEHNAYDFFIDIYERMNLEMEVLISLLHNCGIDEKIINNKVYNNLEEIPFLYLIVALVTANDREISESIKILIQENRYNTIAMFINDESLENLKYFSKDELINLSDEELQKNSVKKEVLLKED